MHDHVYTMEVNCTSCDKDLGEFEIDEFRFEDLKQKGEEVQESLSFRKIVIYKLCDDCITASN